MIVDDDDISLNVAQDERFISLKPGESWVTSQHLQGTGWTGMPSDMANGETFRYVFIGAVVDWWDWGTKVEHEDTTVKLPCWLAGPIVDPKDNDGRPKVVVPASNQVEFDIQK